MDEFTPNLTWKQKWDVVTEQIPTAQDFADVCFYSMISAALQRRVWMGKAPQLYTNTITMLVGPPATGKGVIIQPLSELLKHHKMARPDLNNLPAQLAAASNEKVKPEGEVQKVLSVDDMEEKALNAAKAQGNAVLVELLEEAREQRRGAAGTKKLPGEQPKHREELLVIPIGANATTYEALTKAMARSVRRIGWKRLCEHTGKQLAGVYVHCSMLLILTEASSLIKPRAENIVNFITDIYDCIDPYKYETKHMGTDIINKPCLNLIAGTTPAYMQQCFSEQILNDGFASRSWFLWAARPRFFKWKWSYKETPAQKLYFDELIERTLRWSKVYGEVTMSPEAEVFAQQWWEQGMFSGKARKNKSPKLDSYYGRKDIHMKKMCMLMHFAETPITADGDCSMQISLATAEKALALLDRIEVRMHEALQFGAANPLHKPMTKILRGFQDYPDGMFTKDILVEFWDDLPPPPQDNLELILEYMEANELIQKVTAEPEPGKGYRGNKWMLNTSSENLQNQIIKEKP